MRDVDKIHVIRNGSASVSNSLKENGQKNILKLSSHSTLVKCLCFHLCRGMCDWRVCVNMCSDIRFCCEQFAWFICYDFASYMYFVLLLILYFRIVYFPNRNAYMCRLFQGCLRSWFWFLIWLQSYLDKNEKYKREKYASLVELLPVNTSPPC